MAHDMGFVKKLGIRGHDGTPILSLAAVACNLPRSGRQAYFLARGSGLCRHGVRVLFISSPIR